MGAFRVVLEMDVDGDNVDRFEQEWLRTAQSFRSVPGILRQTLSARVEDRRHFTITSDWTDADCFHAFEVSARQDAATAALRRLRSSSIMRTEELLAVVNRED